jgi:diguanylate cyclase (GGDEF)-like protein
MVRMQRSNDRQSVLPARFGRKITLWYAACVALIALLTATTLFMFDQTIATSAVESTVSASLDNERMLSQRVASLVGQYALGNVGVRGELRTAIDDFERTHWALIGYHSGGVASAIADPALRAIYFDGSAPLDAAATAFTIHARRIAAMPAGDPALAAQSAPLFAQAQTPLLDALGRVQSVRESEATSRTAALHVGSVIAGAMLLVTLLVSSLVVFRPMARRIAELVATTEELLERATHDPLTGTLNKRSFQARGAIEIQKARRYQRPLSLLMIDADQLPAIEAAHGPDGGAELLRALTSSLFSGTRMSDLVARVEPEQFAILLPETTREGAELLAERLRRKICDMSVPIDDKVVSCTVSIGVAAAEKDASFLWPTFKRADEALYEAKMRGRNQVVVAV